jgi:hypothetical protein
VTISWKSLVCLLNDSDFLIESVMVVSKAFGTIDGEMKNIIFASCFVEVPVSVVKIEMIEKCFGTQQ